MNAHKYNSFRGNYVDQSNMKKTDFIGLTNMTTLSDKKDIYSSNSLGNNENSLTFLKNVQNEIYTGLNKEVEDLRMENKDLKLKLVFLTNSTDILNTFPPVDVMKNEQSGGTNMLSNYIDELQLQLSKEELKRKALDEKISQQQDEIMFLKLQVLTSIDNVPKFELPPIKSSLIQSKDHFKINFDFLKCNYYEIDPVLPSTIYGCHAMIKNLVKSRDKKDREISALQRKLNNFCHPNRNFNMHNYLNYGSLPVNNSNQKRTCFLPMIFKNAKKNSYH